MATPQYVPLGKLNIPSPREGLTATYTSRKWSELREFWHMETQLADLPTEILPGTAREAENARLPGEASPWRVGGKPGGPSIGQTPVS